MGKVRSNSWTKAATAASLSWSVRLTASTSSPRGLKDWYIFSMAGISARQGGHQVAQKLTSTTFPRSPDRLACPPPSSSRVKSGALKPSRGLGGGAPPEVAAAGAREVNVQITPNARAAKVNASQRRSSFSQLFK